MCCDLLEVVFVWRCTRDGCLVTPPVSPNHSTAKASKGTGHGRVSYNHGRTMSLLLAVCPGNRDVTFRIQKEGAFSHDSIVTAVVQALRAFGVPSKTDPVPPGYESMYIVWDNAPCHKVDVKTRVLDVFGDAIQFADNPPNSPDLSLCELQFSLVRAIVRRFSGIIYQKALHLYDQVYLRMMFDTVATAVKVLANRNSSTDLL